MAAGTTYLYFDDRDDLIRQLHREIIKTFAEYVLAEHDPTKSLVDQYAVICRSVWRFCANNSEILLSKGQFDHLPPSVLQDHQSYAWQAFQPLTDFFSHCRRDRLIRPLPDEILASLAIDPFLEIARKFHLGLLSVDDATLLQLINATWHAIATERGREAFAPAAG